MGNRLLGACLIVLTLLLAGCGSIDLWPFGAGESSERSRAPSDASEYRCDGGKRFYLRYLNNGASAWIIFPERQFRLDKDASASGARYRSRIAVLEVNGDEATLRDADAVFTGCKILGREK